MNNNIQIAPKGSYQDDIMYGKNMIRFDESGSFPADGQLPEAPSEDEDVVSDFNEKHGTENGAFQNPGDSLTVSIGPHPVSHLK